MVLDVTFLIVLAWGVYRGGSSGFVRYIFSSLAFVIGIIGAVKLTHTFAHFMQMWLGWQSKYLPFLGFIVAFVCIVILVRLLSNFLDKIIRFLYLNIFNRLAGAVLGGLLFTLFFSLFLWLFNQVQLLPPSLKSNSVTYAYVQPVFPVVMEWTAKIAPVFQGGFESLNQLFKEWSMADSVS